METAPVSVVIPTYNRRELVRDAIDSVLAQTLRPAEVIVIDDGSRDGTSESLRSYGDRVCYRFQTNAGLSAARNHGIRVATQPFIALLDDDDAWHPLKLELQMRAFRLHPRLALLGTDQFLWPVETFPTVCQDIADRVTDVTWEQLVVRTLITVCTVVFRREVVDAVGDFDVTLPSSEDREFFLRVAGRFPVGVLNIPLTGIRDTPGSMCKQADGRERAMRRILHDLDHTGAWRGRRLLRWKSYSYLHHTCANAQARAGNNVGALVRQLKSFGWYPLPYRACEVGQQLERPKRLGVTVLRLLKLKGPDTRPEAKVYPARNALRPSTVGVNHGSIIGAKPVTQC